MPHIVELKESTGNNLCKSCGLCCTGHLFIWAKLRPAELDPAEMLGLSVFRDDPRQRGFSHPCPLWKGLCTIHDSPHYPHICRAYKCKLLKEVLLQNTTLIDAQAKVAQAKQAIHALEVMLPHAPHNNFRQRWVAQLEASHEQDPGFKLKAEALLQIYAEVFGVTDLLEQSGEM